MGASGRHSGIQTIEPGLFKIMNIQNCAAIVTGGGSGLGAETARYLAKAGAKVAVFDINLANAEKIAKEINGAAIECNVSDTHSTEAAFAKATDIHGPVRICINCAGVAPAKRIVGREGAMPLEDFTTVININLIGTFNILRLAAAAMSQLDPLNTDGERGVIINTASVAAFEGQIGQAAYSASKGGVAAMTLPAARELARFGIRVMTIAPGIMTTPMMTAMPQEVQDSLAQQIPFPKRLGKASEYAQLALHIIENSLLNGSVIRLDGAIRMGEK
jgi:NAD(P)-dependent dehydrogenase (short-subunit alcohol dehydrogenase family)